MEQNTKVKICGVKDPDIAMACLEYGADFIGFNFSPFSKRKIEPDNLSEIFSIFTGLEERSAKLVALFYKNSEEEITSILSEFSFDYVQYVVQESFELPLFLGSFGIPLLPQFQVKDDFIVEDIELFTNEYMILDSYSKDAGGGTGETFNWDLLRGIQRKYFLAGGLNPGNVREAIQKVKPFGVDVASGVESLPGKKDRNLIKEFIQNAKK
ncbi:MAG: phosphoribosylanthranilate isomerase [Leptospiraceae bacterium]|nr:phosphoribosylanthranilate isomerase [Leptospiraceae bacterium]MCP5499474.1 phosphoribosylanthranilate isomerase [Leptospiraceae bacterium]